MSESVVAVVKTTPETVLADVGKAMRLANYQDFMPKESKTGLKINISWHYWYPACSTTPWQMEGVIKTMLEDGYDPQKIYGCNNRTVVVSARRGEYENKHAAVLEKYNLANVHLYEPGEEWITYQPKGKMLALPQVYPDGIQIPKRLVGSNVIHLPTMKSHVFTTITGAMKNAFGGLLHEKRHWTHAVIHETLVDLLTIQKEIHSGIFAVTDGTFVGDGPGPRCMRIHTPGYFLASGDQVAIDAIQAKMMGFDPMSLPFIRLAHEAGLGCGDPTKIEVAGEDISNINWHMEGKKNTFASKGQKLIYHGPLKHLEHLLLRTWIAPWSYYASRAYHDLYWYRHIGKKRVAEARKTEWGKLFDSYPFRCPKK